MQKIETAHIPTSYSKGFLRRASSLEQLLSSSLEVLQNNYSTTGISLLVLSKSDWQKMFSYRYGLVTLRVKKQSSSLLAPAQYPYNLLHSFDNLLLAVGKKDLEPTGELHEYLDLLILLEFLRAVLIINDKKVELEVQASQLFWQLLSDLKLCELAQRCYEWASIFDTVFELKIKNHNRNKLVPQNKLALYSHYLLQTK